ncbi:hypothetical protein OUZ56_015609 [Daphnia magna]|uniref:Uncharacterized protein n=1 Tax=Daphnia magna TaxID=35525 RepID=A0ABR0ANS9_9CRUS|nr:hypothetical protein OUZ56_015609 [Daphnia magna]
MYPKTLTSGYHESFFVDDASPFKTSVNGRANKQFELYVTASKTVTEETVERHNDETSQFPICSFDVSGTLATVPGSLYT